jgi:hypothetical protein
MAGMIQGHFEKFRNTVDAANARDNLNALISSGRISIVCSCSTTFDCMPSDGTHAGHTYTVEDTRGR